MHGETSLETSKLDGLDYFFGLYVLTSSVIARFAIQYPMGSALIIAPNIFIVPYLVGTGIVCTFSKAFNCISRSLKFLTGFFSGCLFLHSLFVLTDFLGYRIDMTIFNIIIGVTIILGFLIDGFRRISVGTCKIDLSTSLEQTRPRLSLVFCVLTVFAIAVLAFYVPKIKLPFPLVSYDHAVGQETLKPVARLMDDGLLDVAKARILPAILQAIVCSLSSVPVSHLSWAAPLTTSLAFSISMFSFAYSITKKRAVAIASVFFAIFLNSGYSFFFDSVYFTFRYSTIQTAIFPLVIQEVYLYFSKVKDEEKRKPVTFLFMGTILLISAFYVFEFLQPPFLTSFFLGNEYLKPPLIFIFLSLVLMCSTRIKNQTVQELIYFLSLFVTFALILDIFRPVLGIMFVFFFWFLLRQANTEEVKSFHLATAWIETRLLTLSWSGKIVLLRIFAFIMLLWIVICIAGYVNLRDFSPLLGAWGVYTLTKLQSLIAANSVEVIAIFLVVSVPLIFSMNLGEFALAFVSLAGLSAYFLPLTELFYVAYNISNITIGFAIAAGLFKVVGQFVDHYLGDSYRVTKQVKISGQSFKTVLGLLLCLIVAVPVIQAPITRFTWVGDADYRSILANYERKAMEEYISKLPEDVRIISDPFSMIFLTSLTNRVGLVEHGIAPLTEEYKSADTVSTIWKDVFHGASSLEIHQSIMKLQNIIPPDEEQYIQRIHSGLNLSRFMVLVSSRTSWWLDHNDPLGYHTLFPHSANVCLSDIVRFLDPLYFNLSYAIDQKIYIFMVEKSSNNSSHHISVDYLSEEPQTAFWKVDYHGEGNASIVLSQLKLNIDGTQLNNYLNIAPTTGNCEVWSLFHTFTDYIDMSNYQLLVLPFYGKATNNTFYFSFDGPTIFDRTIFLFRDDFEGWNSIMLSLDSPTVTEEKPDLAKVIRVTFSPFIGESYTSCELWMGPITLWKIEI